MKKKIQDGFGYDLDEALSHGNFFEKIFHQSRLKFWLSALDYNGKKILDVGCNTGILLIPFKERGFDMTGVDISKNDISKLKQKLAQKRFKTDCVYIADAKKLPFSSSLFNIVILSDILEHTNQPETAAKEALRVIKKGGIIMATVPNGWHPVVKFAWVRKLLTGRKNVDEFQDIPFTKTKLKNLFPNTETVDYKLIGFGSEIFMAFKKI